MRSRAFDRGIFKECQSEESYSEPSLRHIPLPRGCAARSGVTLRAVDFFGSEIGNKLGKVPSPLAGHWRMQPPGGAASSSKLSP